MKLFKIYLILFLAFLSNQLSAQYSAYYDAFYLSKIAKINSGKFKLAVETRLVLENYYRDTLSDHDLIDAIEANPFLNDYFERPGAQSIPPGLNPPELLNQIGSLDVTNIADGFAKFLVKRTKQELSVAFFDRFYQLLKRKEYEDARILFPQTYNTLLAIGDQIYNYEAFINALRESFEKDLNGLIVNLPKVIEDERYSKFFGQHPDLKAMCLSSLYIGNGLISKQHPGEIIAGYDVALLDNINLNVKGSIQTLQLFSESLKSINSDHYWVTKDSLKILIDDPIAFQIYLGLIYQNADGITFHIPGSDLTFRNILDSIHTGTQNIKQIKDYMNGFIDQTKIVSSSIKNISGKEREKLNFTDYYDFYNSSLDLIEYAYRVKKLPLLATFDPIDEFKFQKFIKIGREGGNIAMDINRKNYSSAVIHAYTIYDFVFGGSDLDLDKIIGEAAQPRTIIDTVIKLKTDRGTILNGTTETFKQFILKYGSFMAAISQAQNSDEVSAAIEAAALPSGSSRIKRESAFNVSLNAYVGLYGGGERINGLDNPIAFSYGVTAPVGISISRGHSVLFLGTGKKGWKEGHCGWSTSLMLSVVDIGALASFRFKSDNDTISQVPKIELRDILSPGAFISIGFPKSPVSINFGAQVGPNLRKVGSEVNDYSNKLYWRLSAAICVDIPVVNFYTRPKMK